MNAVTVQRESESCHTHTHSTDRLPAERRRDDRNDHRPEESYLIETHDILGRTVRIDGGKDGLLAGKKHRGTEGKPKLILKEEEEEEDFSGKDSPSAGGGRRPQEAPPTGQRRGQEMNENAFK